MLTSLESSLIVVAACLVLGFPVAYFLAFKVENLRNQIALFILALAPFWTSFLIRSVAWTYPLNYILAKVGVASFSSTSVRLALIQLYILFMITPLFFTLSQVDVRRSRLPATSAATGGGPSARSSSRRRCRAS
jgi:putative spermidine/putrescine transport system permease protein